MLETKGSAARIGWQSPIFARAHVRHGLLGLRFGGGARRSLSQPGGKFRLRQPAGGQMAPRTEPLPRGSAEIVTVDPQKRFAGNIGDSLVAIDKGVVPRDTNCVTGCQGREVRTGVGIGPMVPRARQGGIERGGIS